jgi:PAS domain-containing protein
VRVELLNRSRDGRDYWIDADIQPLRDVTGALTGFIAVETEITEQVTQRLRSAALLAALPTAVVVHGRQGEVLDANRAATVAAGPAAGRRRRWTADAARARCTRTWSRWRPAELPVQRSLRSGVARAASCWAWTTATAAAAGCWPIPNRCATRWAGPTAWWPATST